MRTSSSVVQSIQVVMRAVHFMVPIDEQSMVNNAHLVFQIR